MRREEQQLRQEIIKIGKRLYDLRLVVAKGGNLSASLGSDLILITASGCCLGQLKEKDILKVNLTQARSIEDKALTTEFSLHSLIYKNFKFKTVIHCHPPLINAYYSVNDSLENITFESKLFLGKVPQVKQATPNISQPQDVIEVLRLSNIVVIKNHGVVCMHESFDEAFYLIEELEEAVRTAAVARLFKKENLNLLNQQLKQTLSPPKSKSRYDMFTREHIEAILDLVKNDEFILKKGKELDLTLGLAMKVEGEDEVYKFHFEQGKVKGLEFDDNTPFVISAPQEVWRLIFQGQLDPFVAITQGKMRLKGGLGRLSRWYEPLSRLFELFKAISLK
ncbi:MAG: class II aldolase/adducin family protein [Candidatus Omnitrophica bacterium]|nr:class II aldolase/adducin family protein [Candidatus Omnitrophota bacterium]